MPRGYLDLGITRDHISGWAFDEAHPAKPVRVCITDNGEPLVSVLANRYRGDLDNAGIGGGYHSFDLYLPTALTAFRRHVVRATIESTGEELGHSPLVIEASNALDADVEQSLANLIASADAQTLDRAVDFLAVQMEAILSRRADLASHRTLRHFRQRFTRHRGQRRPNEAPQPPLRALIIAERIPQIETERPLVDIMLSIQRLGYEVTFVPSNLQNNQATEPHYLEDTEIFIHQEPYTASVEEVLRRQQGSFDVVITHGLATAARYLPIVRHTCATARAIYLRTTPTWREQLPMGSAQATFLEQQYRRQLAETTAINHADDILTTIPGDDANLDRSSRTAKVEYVPWTVTPTPTVVPFEARAGVTLLGSSMGPLTGPKMRPLLDAVIEAVWSKKSTIPFLLPDVLAGRTTQAQIIPFDRETNPKMMSRVTLALGSNPIREIADSAAAAIPCVTTEIALGDLVTLDQRPTVEDHDAGAIADQLVELHEDEELNQTLAHAQLERILKDRSTNNIDLMLSNFLKRRKRIR